MNRYTRRELQVGIAVLIGAAVLIWGVLWFQQVRVAGSVLHYQADFASVGGLKLHDRVQVRGIKAGTVEGLTVMQGKVRVSFYVDKEMPLTRNARVQLMSQGIVGDRLVEIDPGEGEPAPDGYVFQGIQQADMMAMAADGADMIKEAKALTVELRELVAELRRGDRVGGALDDTRAALSTLKETTETLSPELTSLVRELRVTNRAIRQTLVGPDSLLGTTLGDADRTLVRADSLAVTLLEATATLAAIAADLQAGKGTAGRILADDSLYALAESTLVAVKDLIEDVKARPKRYFKVSVF